MWKVGKERAEKIDEALKGMDDMDFVVVAGETRLAVSVTRAFGYGGRVFGVEVLMCETIHSKLLLESREGEKRAW